MSTHRRDGWIFGPRTDLAVFGGPVLAALVLIALATHLGRLETPLPPYLFAVLIVACDVGHVWSTAFRVYLDPLELRRRPALYIGAPLLCLAGGIALHAHSSALFWRALAYLAAFHFVRQQWGWVAYSRVRAGEEDRAGRIFDQLVLYGVTVLPLLWWHAHLPRAFDWFVSGDFAPLPSWVGTLALPLHWTLVAVYALWQLIQGRRGRGPNRAKLFLLATTWITWYGGIVVWNSDLAFTALNVLAHGVPYIAFVWRFERERWRALPSGGCAALFRPGRAWLFLVVLFAAGYAEEWLWDRAVWHEHTTLFPGPLVELGNDLLALLVPLLALPQATHYVLDGWIWRRRDHPELRTWIG